MNILLPVHHFLPTYRAGAEMYTAKLARRLRARGHVVEIAAIESIERGGVNELIVEQDTYDGGTVHRLSFNLAAAPDRDRWLFDNPLLGEWFDRYFREHRPDVVHFQAGYLLGVAPIFAAKANQIPSVLTLHDYWFLCPRHTLLRGDGAICEEIPVEPAACVWCNRLMQRRYQWLDRITIGQAGKLAAQNDLFQQRSVIQTRRHRIVEVLDQVDAILSPSYFLARVMESIVPPGRIEVLRFGLDRPDGNQQTTTVETDGLCFGYIGQVAEHKGVHLLIEAFRSLRASAPVRLDIYGGASVPAYQQRLERIANGDRRIRFHGRFDNHAVYEILASFSVLVAPSIWYENSPLVIQEAQAAHVPVITAALGGMQELVDDHVNGLLFEPGSVESLTAQLQRLIDQPQLLQTLQNGAQQTLLRSVVDEIDDLEAIYARIDDRRGFAPNQHASRLL